MKQQQRSKQERFKAYLMRYASQVAPVDHMERFYHDLV